MRRIFFLLPDQEHTKNVVDELTHQGIDQSHLHIISRQGKDSVYTIERLLWAGNMAVFFIALLITVILIAIELPQYAILTLGIMFISFILGAFFTIKIPNVHITEFDDALKHGEVLLVVDTKKQQVHDIENIVHRRHPEAITGGVGWTM